MTATFQNESSKTFKAKRLDLPPPNPKKSRMTIDIFARLLPMFSTIIYVRSRTGMFLAGEIFIQFARGKRCGIQ
jgi:hypothetical protein